MDDIYEKIRNIFEIIKLRRADTASIDILLILSNGPFINYVDEQGEELNKKLIYVVNLSAEGLFVNI